MVVSFHWLMRAARDAQPQGGEGGQSNHAHFRAGNDLLGNQSVVVQSSRVVMLVSL